MTVEISCSVELCMNFLITSLPGCTQTSLLSTDKPAVLNIDFFTSLSIVLYKAADQPNHISKPEIGSAVAVVECLTRDRRAAG